MDQSALPAAAAPPIPRHAHGRHNHDHHTGHIHTAAHTVPRRRDLEAGPPHSGSAGSGTYSHQRPNSTTTTTAAAPSTPRRSRTESATPASPEVISNLITSLSVISRPATDHFNLPLELLRESPVSSADRSSSFSVPRRLGSFGVDYGAFSSPSSSDVRQAPSEVDDLAAAPPVIKTAKPPSGLSPLTAQKSPTRRDSGGGLRSLLGSRPSSRGSVASRDADAHSLGNISVERGVSAPSSPIEVRKARSSDSWGKKSGRAHKGLMYMTSKERLQENEGRKRASIGKSSSGSSSNGLANSAMARTSGSRTDPFLAQVAISEEPLSLDELIGTASTLSGDSSMSARPIPTRDSSLRKTGANAMKRSSTRSTRSQRDSDHSVIPEEDYFGIGVAKTTDKSVEKVDRRHSYNESDVSRRSSRLGKNDRVAGEGLLDPLWATATKPTHYIDRYVTDTETEMDDGAPSPHIAQGKRRDRNFSSDRSSRRRSGRSTPELRMKRSSSRLKRLSGPLSPRAEEKPKESSETTNVMYERPPSADSIDDAVEAYLRSQRLSQKIRHPQTGRVISFSEVGDSEGSAVFCCVGMGLTRYITAFYDELALTLKLRLITPDRPGVGDSEPYVEGTATPLGWPDDVYAICQALKITKFSILAHSAGAIYALATALRMPQHIRGRIHLLAPWIPPSQMSVFGASAQAPLPPTNAIPTSQKILRALPTPFLKAANSSFMSATSSSITSSLPKQKKTKRKASGKAKDTSSKNADHDKENINNMAMLSDMPSVTREFPAATEEMDQIRPEGASPTGALSPVPGAYPSSTGGDNLYGGIGSGGRGHTSNDSNGGRMSVMSKEEAILAAAESAAAARERQEAYDTRLTHAIWELATTGANPAVDLLVCLERRHTIGFRYVDITRPVIIHHGSRDTRVPVENVKWLGKTMRRCEVRVLEGEGHGLMASASVMGTVLMEISKEWEDWNKVTGQAGLKEDGGGGGGGGRLRRGTRSGRDEF